MGTALALRMPWGRYHATPWGHNVNEALVEWPPSPWRILRALYATWCSRAPHLGEVVHGLLDALAAPPEFELPDHAEAHTRHYLPDTSAGTDKALDAFAVVERGATIIVRWLVELPDDQRAALAELAELLPYLGRAESVCEARLVGDDEALGGARCRPVAPSRGGGSTRVLVPEMPLDMAALTARTVDIRRQRRIDPPGAVWVDYEEVRPAVPMSVAHQPRPVEVTAVRWTIVAPSRPSRHATVAMTNVLRQALLKRFDAHVGGGRSATLAGKDAAGVPLRGHTHAHYLAFSREGGPLLDTLALWAPTSLSTTEVAAAGELRRLWGRAFVSDFRPCHLALEAYGRVEDVLSELVGPAMTWESETPFAPPRHAKRSMTWSDHVETQVRDELDRRGHPAPTSVGLLAGDWSSYRSYRPSGERIADARRVSGLHLEFAEPVQGPLALGALGHFGLGLLRPTMK